MLLVLVEVWFWLMFVDCVVVNFVYVLCMFDVSLLMCVVMLLVLYVLMVMLVVVIVCVVGVLLLFVDY